MTFEEAVATHAPAWVGIWLDILFFSAIVLPLSLVIWKATRLTALFVFIAAVFNVVGVMTLYQQLGYVRLLGLPHIIAWTPLAIHLWFKMKSPDVSAMPRVITGIAFTTIMISLAFDYVDLIRYIAGERTPPSVATL